MRIKKFVGALLLAVAAPLVQADTDAYIAGMGTYVYPDAARDASYGGGGQFLVGLPVTDDLDLEFNLHSISLLRESSDHFDHAYGGGVDLHYNLADSRVFGLYFVAGIGGMYERGAGDSNFAPYANAGFSGNFWALFGYPRLSLRTEARYYGIDHKDSTHHDHPAFAGKEWLGDARLNLGLQWDFGDVEGVRRGVDLRDSDADGVIDSKDECPNTPRGVIVDGRGCPVVQDSDGDGINDSGDACPNTPPGVPVDGTGCPLAPPAPTPIAPPVVIDADNDGVPDSLDECPGSLPGTPVDIRGCPRDADNDGVPNELDLCPGTPIGMRVDATGCVVQQVAVFHNINFEFDSDNLTAAAQQVLNGVAAGLQGQPGVKLEIGGHTDSLGTDAYNLSLSQKRAASVKAYLIGKGVSPSRLKAEGFGEFNPIADNNTEAGRAQNRRVEFKVTTQ